MGDRETSAAVLASRDAAGAAMAPSTAMLGPSRALWVATKGGRRACARGCGAILQIDFKNRAWQLGIEEPKKIGDSGETRCRIITTRLSVVWADSHSRRLSAGKIRTMVGRHSVSAGRETPSRTAMVESRGVLACAR